MNLKIIILPLFVLSLIFLFYLLVNRKLDYPQNYSSAKIRSNPVLHSARNDNQGSTFDSEINSQTLATEVTDKRTLTSKTFNLGNGRFQYQQTLKTILHYPSAGPDSQNLDSIVDFTPQRIDNSQLDGWTITQANWHYALGMPKTGILANQDGVVGFGGRQGQNWIKYKLERLGYLNYTTKDWQDIGGPANYDRANLSQQTQQLTIGPEGQETINVSASAQWRHLWDTPDNGEIYIHWQAEGQQLKEEITLNQSARDWIVANRPPSPGHNWFGFLFKLDISDIPKIIKNNIQQTNDFDDSDGYLQLKDDLDRLLAFMPLDYAYLENDDSQKIALRKRIWQDLVGNWWLLVGAPTSDLNSLPAGAIIFDPTLESQPDATQGDDVWLRSNSDENFGLITTFSVWQNSRPLIRFDLSSIPSGSTVTSATLTMTIANPIGTSRILQARELSDANGDWIEGTKNNTLAAAGEPCWDAKQADGSGGVTTAWAGSNGANTADTDYKTPVLGSITWNNTDPANSTRDISFDTSQVAAWCGQPTNNGFMLATTTTEWISGAMYSSDVTTAAYRPKLTVEYSPATSSVQFDGVKMEGVKIN